MVFVSRHKNPECGTANTENFARNTRFIPAIITYSCIFGGITIPVAIKEISKNSCIFAKKNL